ncbi:hypothetical protein D3C72_2086450 [compost metagenome]
MDRIHDVVIFGVTLSQKIFLESFKVEFSKKSTQAFSLHWAQFISMKIVRHVDVCYDRHKLF